MKTRSMKRLDRDFCIIKYRNLPLTYYVKETDEDIYSYPKIESFYWIKLKDFDNQKKRSFEETDFSNNKTFKTFAI